MTRDGTFGVGIRANDRQMNTSRNIEAETHTAAPLLGANVPPGQVTSSAVQLLSP